VAYLTNKNLFLLYNHNQWRNKNEIFDKESGNKAKPAYVIEIVKPNKENSQKYDFFTYGIKKPS